MSRAAWFRITAGILILVDASAFGQIIDAAAGESDALTVRIYDLAGAPSATVGRAAAEAARILAVAGVKTIWEHGDPAAEEANTLDMSGAFAGRQGETRNYLAVRLVKGVPRGSFRTALGLALPGALFGSHVTVFYDRVELVFATLTGIRSDGLGTVLAHEIGHILLDSDEHSSSGLMKARWSISEMRLALTGRLHFTPDESHRVREGARRRLKSMRPPVEVLTDRSAGAETSEVSHNARGIRFEH